LERTYIWCLLYVHINIIENSEQNNKTTNHISKSTAVAVAVAVAATDHIEAQSSSLPSKMEFQAKTNETNVTTNINKISKQSNINTNKATKEFEIYSSILNVFICFLVFFFLCTLECTCARVHM
jgi:hypothetical protein